MSEHRQIGSEGRRAEADMQRAERKMQEAGRQRAEAIDRLDAVIAETERRLGITLPGGIDGFALDVLSLIDVGSGDEWLWCGRRNNEGLPVIVLPRGHRLSQSRHSVVSAVRFLAVTFGVIGLDDNGILYPIHSPQDVNPWHRELRRSDKPVGVHDGTKSIRRLTVACQRFKIGDSHVEHRQLDVCARCGGLRRQHGRRSRRR